MSYLLTDQRIFRYFITTSRGCEAALCEEIEEIIADLELQDASEPREGSAGVALEADLSAGIAINLASACASRVLLIVAEGFVNTLEDVYALSAQVDWPEFFKLESTFAITTNVTGEIFQNNMIVGLKVKDGLADKFRSVLGERPNVSSDNPDIRIVVRVVDTILTISLDMSGEAMGKRGYRTDAGEAPLRENLAASLLRMSGFHKVARALQYDCEPEFFERASEDVSPVVSENRRIPTRLPLSPCLLDPMCGSGTFLIEAAIMLLGRAPGMNKARFGFESLFPDFEEERQELTEKIKQDLKAREIEPEECLSRLKIYLEKSGIDASSAPSILVGSDSDGSLIEIARANAVRAGVESLVTFTTLSAELARPHASVGQVVTNPPYGERLGDLDSIKILYTSLGNTWKHQFPGWTAWLISGNDTALKTVGLRPTRRIAVYNGNIACRFCQFVMYK